MARLKYTKDEIDDLLDQVKRNGNLNLLDNSHFRINQEGFSSGSGATGAYPADRWVTYGYTASVVSRTEDGHIEFNGGNATASTALRQYYRGGYLPAGKYTLSVNVTGGSIGSRGYYGFLSVRNGNTTVGSQPNIRQLGITSMTFDAAENQINNITISVYKDAIIEIECAKLEVGDKSTLENDAAPDDATELPKCQYYRHAYGSAAARPSNALDCVPTMRTTPSQKTVTGADGITRYMNIADL